MRGGSEALASNQALAALVTQALRAADLPEHGVQLVPTTDRAAVGALITMPQFVDVIIPRGGKGLIERISAEAKVPVIKHLDGNCHTYVDDPCDLDMAVTVTDNAKTQKFSPCNASESLLVARGVAAQFLPRIGAIFAKKGVEMRVCPASKALLAPIFGANVVDATEEDWRTEYLGPIISIPHRGGAGGGHCAHQPLFQRPHRGDFDAPTTCMRSSFCARSIPAASWSIPAPALPMGLNTAWGGDWHQHR